MTVCRAVDTRAHPHRNRRATITTKRGAEVSRDGSEEDPAVIVKTQNGSDGIKYAHELDGVKPSS